MLGSKTKRELKRNQRRILIDSIEIGIPSPQQIQSWGERQLPNGKKVGEVKNSKTVNYKRFTPLRDGLFCERIFGPVNSWICACGKRQVRADWSFCEKCEVEYTDQRTRRNRLGFISLVSPVAHIWYLKGRPSYLSLFLGKRKKRVVQLAYCNAYLVETGSTPKSFPSEALVPGGVMTETKQREAHGAEKYKKNIRSRVITQQFSNLFYRTAKNQLSLRDNKDTNLPILKNKPKTLFSTNSLFSTPILRKAPVLPSSAKTPTNKKPFESFDTSYLQKDIKQKTSPLSFFHLLTELLGYIEKDFLLSHALQTQDRKTKTDSFRSSLSAKKAPLFDATEKRKKTVFVLRALWAYTCSKNDTKHLNEVESFGFRERKSTENIIRKQIFDSSNPNSIVSKYLNYAKKRSSTVNNLSFYKSCFDLTPTIFSFASQKKNLLSYPTAKQLHKPQASLRVNTSFSTLLPNKSTAKANWQRLNRDFSYKTNVRTVAQTPERLFGVYDRSHTFPFLPDFICKYNLRDELLNFLNSSPYLGKSSDLEVGTERQKMSNVFVDRPIPFYCKIAHWQPLRDVHKFMSEQVLSQFYEKQSSTVPSIKTRVNQTNSLNQNKNSLFKERNTVSWNLWAQIQFIKRQFLMNKFEARACGLTISFAMLQQMQAAQNSIESLFEPDRQKRTRDIRNKVMQSRFRYISYVNWVNAREKRYQNDFVSIAVLARESVFCIQAKHSFARMSSAHASIKEDTQSWFLQTSVLLASLLQSRTLGKSYRSFFTVNSFFQKKGGVTMDATVDNLSNRDAFALLNESDLPKLFLESENGTLNETSSHLSETKEKSDSHSQTLFINGFTSQNPKLKKSANILSPKRNNIKNAEHSFAMLTFAYANVRIDYVNASISRADASMTEKGQYKEFTNLEKVNSLRHILYMSLIEKSCSIGNVQTDALEPNKAMLGTRMSQMFALFTQVSREKLIFDTIQVAQKKYLPTSFSISKSKRKPFNFTSNPEFGKRRLSQFVGFFHSHLQEAQNVTKHFYATEYTTNKENSFYHLTDTEVLQTQNRMVHAYRTQNSELVLLDKLKGSIGLAHTLQSQSPERLYRSILLDKTWIRSFILKKHWLQQQSNSRIYKTDQLYSKNSGLASGLTISFAMLQQTRAFAKQMKDPLWKSKKKRLSQHTQLLPSLLHPFLQCFENKRPVHFYRGIVQNVWNPQKKTRLLNQKDSFGSVYRFEQYQDFLLSTKKSAKDANILQMQSIAKQMQPLNTFNFVKNNCAVLKRYAEKNIFWFEKRFLHSVYNSTFVMTDKDPQLDTFVSSNSKVNVPGVKNLKNRYKLAGETQLGNKLSPFSIDNDTSSEQFELLFPRASFDEIPYNRLEKFTKALSFFLILPHSQKRKLKNNNLDTFPFSVLPAQKSKEWTTLEKSTSLQVQIRNGNSQLVETVQDLSNTYYHHINVLTGQLDYEQPVDSEAMLTFAKQMYDERFKKMPENTKTSSFRFYLERSYQSPCIDIVNARAADYTLFDKNSTKLVEQTKLYESGTNSILPQNERFHLSQVQLSGVSRQNSSLSPIDFTTIREILSYTGGGALQKLLQRFDTQLFQVFLFKDIQATRALYKKRLSEKSYPPSRIEKRILTRICRRIYKNSRRFKLAQLLTRSKRRPEWMMISILPVLPPDLRPILQMSESVVVASDLNNLYQRVIYRNNRFHKLGFIDFHLVTAIQRLVQDAVDRLIENGKGGSKPFYTPSGRPLRSLSDQLKGKKGRFRLNLLGKRVDFSGRSVIVVSPHLKIHECGLPREIALELYHYFLLRQFILKKQASSIVMAKKIIKQKRPLMWDALRDIIYHHPVLLNRAPTLHRLGIQAFQPQLVQGNAILLHPLVCSGFNADFDGDQMGVHLPLSTQARAEAWDLLWSRNNLLSPATGQPVLVPSQDMVLGFYYITQLFPARSLHILDYKNSHDNTTNKNLREVHKNVYKPNVRRVARSKQVFSNVFQLLQAFQNKQVEIHQPVWLQWQDKMENDEISQKPLELRLNSLGSSTYIYPRYKRRQDEAVCESNVFVRTTAGRVLVHAILFT